MIDQSNLNKNLSLSRTIDVLGMPDWLKTKDSSVINALMADVFGVYLGYRQHPAESIPDRWLTITAGGATDDICINQSRGEKRGDVEVYHSLLARALTLVMNHLMRSKWDMPAPLAGSISHYRAESVLPQPGFSDDGQPTPIEHITAWLNKTENELYMLFARIVENNFEKITFLKFPHDHAMAIIGKLKTGQHLTVSCLTLHMDNPFQVALHALLREQTSMQQADTFDYITSINPSVGESAAR